MNSLEQEYLINVPEAAKIARTSNVTVHEAV